ncbi:MAG: hypothetical protein HQL82_08105 [Magnetococcales bacterium]|nr:hypothetical protein [Magnetococcales bacterium]
MVKFFLSLLFLTAVLWALVKLREIRELSRTEILPSDQSTLLLGLFYILSEACLRYNKEKGHYPPVISGARDGLMEKGYLQGIELASMTRALPLFSIVATERTGFGVCLQNTTASLTREILERARMTGNNLTFMDWKKSRYVTLTPPIRNDFINLTLPLPIRPDKK